MHFSREKYPELPHIRYTDDISAMIRGTTVNWNEKPKQNGVAVPETQDKGKTVTDIKDDASVVDEKEADKIINEILEEGEEVSKNIPSDVEEPSHSDGDDTNHSEMNGEVVGPDSEEDGSAHLATQEVDDNIEEDKLESIENNENSTLEEENVSQPNETEKEENESSSMDNNVGDVNDSLDNLDEIVNENEVDANPPASDYVNEEDVTKSEEDNVVDGIVGEGDIDSTNER